VEKRIADGVNLYTAVELSLPKSSHNINIKRFITRLCRVILYFYIEIISYPLYFTAYLALNFESINHRFWIVKELEFYPAGRPLWWVVLLIGSQMRCPAVGYRAYSKMQHSVIKTHISVIKVHQRY